MEREERGKLLLISGIVGIIVCIICIVIGFFINRHKSEIPKKAYVEMIYFAIAMIPCMFLITIGMIVSARKEKNEITLEEKKKKQ